VSEPTDKIHARYIGDSPVVFPHLLAEARCCDPANHREDQIDPETGIPILSEEDGAPLVHTVVRKGDVILLDRYSAEGREDFEILDDQAAPAAQVAPAEAEPAAPSKPDRKK
jgi:hypothetical protein